MAFVFDHLLLAPLIGLAVLQPEDRRRGIRRDMAGERDLGHFTSGVDCDLHGVMAVANGPAVKALLDPGIGRIFADL